MKIIGALIGVILILSLATGCSSNQPTTPPTTTTEERPPTKEGEEQAIRQLNKAAPGGHVGRLTEEAERALRTRNEAARGATEQAEQRIKEEG